MAPVADHIDDHVLVVFHAVIERHLRHEQHRFRIVAVHMEDRRVDHFRHVGAVIGRTLVFLVAGGEADLIVHHDVHGAFGRVTARLRHVEVFHHHALTGKRGVAMNHDGQHSVALLVAMAHLACAHRTFHHGCHDFQVRGIECERHVQGTARRLHIGGESHVILDVAGGKFLIVRAFEFLEQIARGLADDVDQHVQPPAVGHADHDLTRAVRAGPVDQFVHQGNQTFPAFQGKAFLADVFGVQIAFQTLGRGEAFQ